MKCQISAFVAFILTKAIQVSQSPGPNPNPNPNPKSGCAQLDVCLGEMTVRIFHFPILLLGLMMVLFLPVFLF